MNDLRTYEAVQLVSLLSAAQKASVSCSRPHANPSESLGHLFK